MAQARKPQQSRRDHLSTQLVICSSVLLTLCPVSASALPKDPRVVKGSVAVSTSGTTMKVQQKQTKDNKAIVNWSTFNIASEETVNFLQPNTNSLLVNRVTGACTVACHSVIDGLMTANGKIMLINGSGILFGSGARVDVSGLVATTIDFTNDALMSKGAMTSNTSANPNGFVINNGSITVKNAGLAALVAPGVANNGVILAHAGKVALASGKKYTLDFYGDGMVQLAMGSDNQTSALPSPGGVPMAAAVSNTGTITADGGTVALTARTLEGIMDKSVNMSGVIQARSLSTANGKILLHGGDGNTVQVTGSIDATGGTGLSGGTIDILGERVALGERIIENGVVVRLNGGASIDASGGNGGGKVLIGGDDTALPSDRSGTGGVKLAVETVVSKGTRIVAAGGAGAAGSLGITGYVEYHEGDIPLIVTTVHGGMLKPTYIATRDCTGISDCSTSADLKTQELSATMLESISQLTSGGRPHWIVVNLHRSKVDANRPPEWDDGTSIEGQKAHSATHKLIELSARIVQSEHGGRGLLIDIHGTGHSRKAVELGYAVPGSVLNTYSDADLNASDYASSSSIAALGRDSRALPAPDFARVLRGDLSLGALLASRTDAYGEGYVAVPSPNDPGPGSYPYFSGGYLIKRHGSGGTAGGSSIDAVQMEATPHYRTQSDAARDQFARDLGSSLVEFMRLNYGWGI